MNLRKICSNEIVQLYDKIILKIKTLVDPNPKGKNAKKKDEKPRGRKSPCKTYKLQKFGISVQFSVGN